MDVVLLFGAPGAGKSTVGRYLAQEHGCAFFSAGDYLRELGMLLSPTLTNDDLKAACASALRARLQGVGLFFLEFVKDIDDAYALMTLLRECGATLVQAIYLTHVGDNTLAGLRREQHDAPTDRKIAERTPKWRLNAGRLIEFFASTGALTVFEWTFALLHFMGSWQSQPIRRVAHLKLFPLQWVVSPRLITDQHARDRILQTATAAAGLLELCMPVPRADVRTQADLDWVSQPERYTVSIKCDGTRHLLIVNAEGEAFLKNRLDFLYAYELDARPPPPNTILDGELVWHKHGGGHFFVFDALMVGGERVWHLPLPQRLGALKWMSTHIPSVPYIGGMHRQRAPVSDATLTPIRKEHYTVAAFKQLARPPFPQDGLIFTPVAMPYVFPALLRKWQPPHQRGCDIQREKDDLVYECMHTNKWVRIAIRWDKSTGQGAEVIGRSCKDCSTFLQGLDKSPLPFPSLPSPLPIASLPPRRNVLSKPECEQAVKAGLAERTMDARTGLEVFNNRKGVSQPCRGVVFEGDTLLAASFEPFETLDTKDAIHPDQWVRASFKLDGTLVLAFLHRGEVCTATRRRMDSEQAEWARHRLRPAMLREGWTYAFEAVYRDNTVVVPYPFEGLVFLHAWSPDGQGHADFHDSTILCAPSLTCRASDLDQLLRTSERGPPSFEGWVVRTEDGRRLKWVQDAYKHASRAIQEGLHPLAVWREVRMGWDGVSSDRHLPQHAVVERRAMLHALERAFRDELHRWYAALEFDFDAQRTWGNMDRVSYCMLSYVEVANDALRSAAFNRRDSFCTLSPELHGNRSLKDNWAKFWDFDVARFPMHYKRHSLARPNTILRVELLDRIRPSDAGELLHYTPSRHFAQTFAKGWRHGLRAPKPPLIGVMLLDPLLEHIFAFLPTDALARAMFVCKAWCALIVGDRGLMERVHRAMLEEEEEDRWYIGDGVATPRSYGSDW